MVVHSGPTVETSRRSSSPNPQTAYNHHRPAEGPGASQILSAHCNRPEYVHSPTAYHRKPAFVGRWYAYSVLNLRLEILKGIGLLHVDGYGCTSQRPHEYLHPGSNLPKMLPRILGLQPYEINPLTAGAGNETVPLSP